MDQNQGSGLSSLERVLLALPAAGGTVFGLASLLAPAALASVAGVPGNDHYMYRIAGAATLGYAVALALAIWQGDWIAARLPVVATLTFNLASIFACLVEIVRGRAVGVVYLILVASILFVAICGWLLYTRREAAGGGQGVATWVVWLTVIDGALAAVFGILLLLRPVGFGHLFSLKATDIFLYRQAGAATLGYAVMSVF